MGRVFPNYGATVVDTSSDLPTASAGLEGLMFFVKDSNKVVVCSGSAWVEVSDLDNTGAVSDAVQDYLDGYAPAYRNVIINGAMQVHQRGTSSTAITSGAYFTADRWRAAIANTIGTWTNSVENDAPTGSGFQKSWKWLCTTANASLDASDILFVGQFIEGQNVQHFAKGTSAAKKFAVSFWVKSNVTGTYICELTDQDNTRQVSASYTISASATWEKKTIVFPADTTGAFDNDNDQSLRLNFWLVAGSNTTSGTLNTTWASSTAANRAVGQTNLAAATNNYWQITGVQLEAGDVNTPFEFEPFETTLAKCQRYYYTLNNTSAYAIYGGWGAAGGTGFCEIPIIFPVTMRIAPTTVSSGNLAVQLYSNAPLIAVTSLGSFELKSNNGGVITTNTASGSLTTGAFYRLLNNNSTTTYIGFNAEL